ncbi:hypothetical protein JCM8097_001532 [Rhodosporidiobolus ruineniae]
MARSVYDHPAPNSAHSPPSSSVHHPSSPSSSPPPSIRPVSTATAPPTPHPVRSTGLYDSLDLLAGSSELRASTTSSLAHSINPLRSSFALFRRGNATNRTVDDSAVSSRTSASSSGTARTLRRAASTLVSLSSTAESTSSSSSSRPTHTRTASLPLLTLTYVAPPHQIDLDPHRFSPAAATYSPPRKKYGKTRAQVERPLSSKYRSKTGRLLAGIKGFAGKFGLKNKKKGEVDTVDGDSTVDAASTTARVDSAHSIRSRKLNHSSSPAYIVGSTKKRRRGAGAVFLPSSSSFRSPPHEFSGVMARARGVPRSEANWRERELMRSQGRMSAMEGRGSLRGSRMSSVRSTIRAATKEQLDEFGRAMESNSKNEAFDNLDPSPSRHASYGTFARSPAPSPATIRLAPQPATPSWLAHTPGSSKFSTPASADWLVHGHGGTQFPVNFGDTPSRSSAVAEDFSPASTLPLRLSRGLSIHSSLSRSNAASPGLSRPSVAVNEADVAADNEEEPIEYLSPSKLPHEALTPPGAAPSSSPTKPASTPPEQRQAFADLEEVVDTPLRASTSTVRGEEVADEQEQGEASCFLDAPGDVEEVWDDEVATGDGWQDVVDWQDKVEQPAFSLGSSLPPSFGRAAASRHPSELENDFTPSLHRSLSSASYGSPVLSLSLSAGGRSARPLPPLPTQPPLRRWTSDSPAPSLPSVSPVSPLKLHPSGTGVADRLIDSLSSPTVKGSPMRRHGPGSRGTSRSPSPGGSREDSPEPLSPGRSAAFGSTSTADSSSNQTGRMAFGSGADAASTPNFTVPESEEGQRALRARAAAVFGGAPALPHTQRGGVTKEKGLDEAAEEQNEVEKVHPLSLDADSPFPQTCQHLPAPLSPVPTLYLTPATEVSLAPPVDATTSSSPVKEGDCSFWHDSPTAPFSPPFAASSELAGRTGGNPADERAKSPLGSSIRPGRGRTIEPEGLGSPRKKASMSAMRGGKGGGGKENEVRGRRM